MLYRRWLIYLSFVTIATTLSILSQARSRSQPLFYTPNNTLACDSLALIERFSSPKSRYLLTSSRHPSHEIRQSHCRTLTPDQLWERHRFFGSYAEIKGVSPSIIEGLRLYTLQNRLILLEPPTPSFSPAFNSVSTEQPRALHKPTLPPDLPLTTLSFYQIWRYSRFLRRRRRAWLSIRALIRTHQDTLFQRRHHALTPNHYGAVKIERWSKEKDLFYHTVILPTLKKKHLKHFWPYWKKRTDRLINTRTHIAVPERQPSPTFDPPEGRSPKNEHAFVSRMEPLDYERYCAHILQNAGWSTTLTATGSDQGTDIIATRNKVRLIVQCKLYSRPVGNKAVQEVFTACKHQRGHLAAVVSNAGYTRHARQLAASTGVYLLHHRQLSSLDESIPQPGQASFL